jgi:hypothetical protein
MNRPLFFKNEFYISLILVVVVQVVLMFQGFDICDDGFVLTFYQQIFSHPESVEYNFLYWFSGIIGGLWHQLNTDGGILWFRILGVIVNTATFMLSYNILKKYMSPLFLALALTMVLFVNDYGFLTFYHNHLTSLLTVLILYILIRAFAKNNYILFFIVGFVFVLNGLTRLPNFVLCCLFTSIPFYYYLNNTVKKSIKPLIFVFLGCLVAFLFVYLFLLASGQLQVMENAIVTMFDVGNTEGSSHNFKSLLLAQYYNYLQISKVFFEIVIILSISIFVFNFVKANKIITYTLAASFGVLMIFWFQNHGIFSIYTLAYIGSFWLIISKAYSIELRNIAFLSFLMLLTMSIGTGGGIRNSGYMAIWLSFPIFYIAFPSIVLKMASLKVYRQQPHYDKFKDITTLILFCISISFLVLKSYKILNEAYFDKGSRLEKTYVIHNENAKYIYTTKRRAEIINTLLVHLEIYVNPGDYLFAYDHIPMIHFLTETRPYTYNPWPGIYDYNSFEKKVLKAEIEIIKLPIVIVQKFETIIDFSEPLDAYMVPEKNNSLLHGSKSIETMNAFLVRNKYEVVWSNRYFNIYKSFGSDKTVD